MGGHAYEGLLQERHEGVSAILAPPPLRRSYDIWSDILLRRLAKSELQELLHGLEEPEMKTKLLLVGGDQRQKARVERYFKVKITHWEQSYSPRGKFPASVDGVIIWAKHCSHQSTIKARNGVQGTGIPLHEVRATSDLLAKTEEMGFELRLNGSGKPKLWTERTDHPRYEAGANEEDANEELREKRMVELGGKLDEKRKDVSDALELAALALAELHSAEHDVIGEALAGQQAPDESHQIKALGERVRELEQDVKTARDNEAKWRTKGLEAEARADAAERKLRRLKNALAD